MGHDLGHAPLRALGEAALDALLREGHRRRSSATSQSLRVVEVLERDGGGLNLTREVRDGILNHTGSGGGHPRGPDRAPARPGRLREPRHRGRPARRRHRPRDLPAEDVTALGTTTSERLTTLVADIVNATGEGEEIRQSPEIGAAFLRLRRFMFQRVYLAPPASDEAARARNVVQALFRHFHDRPDLMPASPEPDPVTRTTDFVAGMTDRYALRVYGAAFLPREGPL